MSTRMFRVRATPRHHVAIQGKLIIRAAVPTSFACMITDLSLGGAKVVLDEDHPLPGKVFLFESFHQNIYECSVQWRTERTLGLKFVDLASQADRRALIGCCSMGLTEPTTPVEPQATD